MTPAEAAAVYLDYQPIADVISSDLERAKKVLKEHLADPRRTTFKGISTSTGGSTRFDQSAAKQLLGPKRLEQCMKYTPSLGLVLPPSLRKGAVDLQYQLVPAGTAAPEPPPPVDL